MSNAKAGPSNNTARPPKGSLIARMAQARKEKAAKRAAKKEERKRRLAVNLGRATAEDKGKEKEVVEEEEEDDDDEEEEPPAKRQKVPEGYEWKFGWPTPQPKRDWLGQPQGPQEESSDSDADIDEAFRAPKAGPTIRKIKLNVAAPPPPPPPPPPAGTPPPASPAGSPPPVDEVLNELGDMGGDRDSTLSPVPDQKDGDFVPEDDEDELEEVDELEEEPEPVPNDASWEIDCARLEAALQATPDAAKKAAMIRAFEKYKASKLYWTFQRMWTYWHSVAKDSTHLSAAMRMQFANYGKVNVGDERCKRCKDLMFNPKRNGRDGNPGIILQCRQGSPYAKCCHCTISGEECSNKVEKQVLRSGGKATFEQVKLDAASLFIDLNDALEGLDPDNSEDVAAFTKDQLREYCDRIKSIRDQAETGAILASPLIMQEYTEHHEDHGEIRNEDGSLAVLYGN